MSAVRRDSHRARRLGRTAGVRVLRGAIGVFACLCLAGCLPRARINAACRWTDETTTFTKAAARLPRAHLLEDLRVARDLGIRYADVSAGRMNTPAWHDAQRRCTELAFVEMMRAHHLTRTELMSMDHERESWVDVLVVFLPACVLFLLASRFTVAHVAAGYDSQDRAFAAVVLAALAPLAAGVGLALVHIWGVIVEQLRLRNDHISYRAFDLPASRHGWLLWSVAVILFSAAATVELRRMRGVSG